jgi:membrane-associated PAP2 superfamily phosphatase
MTHTTASQAKPSRRSWPAFTSAVVLAVLALFVLPQPVAGMAALGAFVALIAGCILALAGKDTATAERAAIGLGIFS